MRLSLLLAIPIHVLQDDKTVGGHTDCSVVLAHDVIFICQGLEVLGHDGSIVSDVDFLIVSCNAKR